MIIVRHPTKFPLGRLAVTPGVLRTVSECELAEALDRHAHGDWGDCCNEDKAANDQAVDGGDRIFSVYRSKAGVKFWIITEWDRSATTILLPGEY